MPRTEDDGDLLAVVVCQRGQEVTHALHPHGKLLMEIATGQYLLHHCRVGHIPGRALRELLSGPTAALDGGDGIAGMPTQGNNATTTVMVLDLLGHAGEGHAVEILLVAHLYAAQVEAHDGGIVAADVLHVA